MFQIKDFASVTASMINYWSSVQKRVTDFNIGSVARTLVESVAIEIDELYQQMLHGLLEAIPVSTYATFGFERLDPIAASGLIRFGRDSNNGPGLLIPALTQIQSSNGGLVYETTGESLLPQNTQWIDVTARCVTPGVIGNCPPVVLNSLRTPVDGIDWVYNPVGFDNGADQESDDARKLRFRDWVSTLARTTTAGVQEGVRTAMVVDVDGVIRESVAKVKLYEPFDDDLDYPIGLVECYIHSGTGGASDQLVAEAQRIVNGYRKVDGTAVHGWKAAGIVVRIYPAKLYPVLVDGMIWLTADVVSTTLTVQEATRVVREYIESLEIGEPALRARIEAAIMGVQYVANVRLTQPVSDVSVSGRGWKMSPGAVTLALSP